MRIQLLNDGNEIACRGIRRDEQWWNTKEQQRERNDSNRWRRGSPKEPLRRMRAACRSAVTADEENGK